jgi:hypothetical protein
MHSSTKLHLINKLNSNREHAHFECCGFEPWSGQTKDYKMGGHFNIGHYYVLHMHLSNFLQYLIDSIGGVMVSVLALSVVDRGFEPWSGQTKDYKMAGHFNIGHYYVLHMHLSNFLQYLIDSIGGVMVSVLALSVVDRGFEPWSGQTKDYKTDICCFTAKHAAFSSKSKD